MSDLEQAISLPFTISPTGKVATTTDQGKIWQDRILSVIGTALGERAQRYYFGSRVFTELFESESKARETVPAIIGEAITTYLPLITLNNIVMDFDKNTGVMDITIFYTLPNDVNSELKVGSITVNGNLPFKEN
jgi:phage baseplate assembly protein W